MINSEKLSKPPTHGSNLPLPDNTLIIHYASLASDPSLRLEVAAAIGRLLEGADQSYSLAGLASSPASIGALHTWLISEEAGRFWSVAGDVISILQPCEKHVLVGTRHLFHDLATLSALPLPRLSDLDLVWQAAAQLVEQARGTK
jgi:hypothetical protein